jgi:outer membrane murein-binding lipoprotein Lpp
MKHKARMLLILAVSTVLLAACVSKKKHSALAALSESQAQAIAKLVMEREALSTEREAMNMELDSFLREHRSLHMERDSLHALELKLAQILEQMNSNMVGRPSFAEMIAQMQAAYPNETAALRQVRNTVVTDTHIVGATNRPGKLVYYAPAQLRELQRGQIIVRLGELMADTVLRERVLTAVNKRQEQLNEDLISEDDLRSGDVRLSDFMYVHLRGDTGFFDVQKNHLKDTLSTADGGEDEWRWTIAPKEGNGGLKATIEIVVVALDENGDPLYNDEAFFPIEIDLKENIWQAFWNAMGRDPKWTATTIAIPLLSFLFGRWTNRKKEGGDHKNSGAKPALA